MCDDELRLSANYSLARLDGDRLLKLLDIAAERRPRAARFWDWLAGQVSSERNRRASFVDGSVPQEADVIDMTTMAGWDHSDLAEALRAVVAMNEAMSDIEMSVLFQRLTMMVVGIVCHRLKKLEPEAVSDERLDTLDSHPWTNS